jgi:hypothetical protein
LIDRLAGEDNWLQMLRSIPGAPYVIMERKNSLYRRILLGMVSGESLQFCIHSYVCAYKGVLIEIHTTAA